MREIDFNRLAERASQLVSSGKFFAVSVLLVILWIPTLLIIPSVDTWQLVLNTAVSVLAFLLVALLQNTERRNDLAQHQKLDAIAAALADLMEGEGDREALRRDAERLRKAVGVEKDLTNHG